MATPFRQWPVAATGLATVYFLTAFGHAWADNKAEQARWQSAITPKTGGGGPCANREWKSALTAIDRRDAVRGRALDSGVGLQDVGGAGCDNAAEPFDARNGAGRSARVQPGGAVR